MPRLRVALFALLAGVVACTGGPSAETRAQMAAGVALAQARCYRLIHHDTFAYDACLRELLASQARATPGRLGIEYFGWVGALNSARIGMLGAEMTAYEFLGRYRATQQALGIDDRSLCEVIPGDCEARIARMQKMRLAPSPALASYADEPGDPH